MFRTDRELVYDDSLIKENLRESNIGGGVMGWKKKGIREEEEDQSLNNFLSKSHRIFSQGRKGSIPIRYFEQPF